MIDPVNFFRPFAKAHAVNVSYVRKSEVESQHLYGVGESSTLPRRGGVSNSATSRGSQQLYYTAGITTGPLTLIYFGLMDRIYTQ